MGGGSKKSVFARTSLMDDPLVNILKQTGLYKLFKFTENIIVYILKYLLPLGTIINNCIKLISIFFKLDSFHVKS